MRTQNLKARIGGFLRALFLYSGLALAVGVCSAAPVEACPNCKNAHLSGQEAEASVRMSHGFLASYLVMTGMSFVLAGTVVVAFMRSTRAASENRKGAEPDYRKE